MPLSRWRRLALALMLLCSCAPFARAQDEAEQKSPAEIDLVWGLKIPMRDGTSAFLTDDLMRVRYRASFRQAQLVKPGEVNRYEFDSFQFFSRRVQKGSRLRLYINSPDSIYLQKNYSGGGDVAAEMAKDERAAHVTLYRDPEHPSFLEISVVK